MVRDESTVKVERKSTVKVIMSGFIINKRSGKGLLLVIRTNMADQGIVD
jgi:hypothetical protein